MRFFVFPSEALDGFLRCRRRVFSGGNFRVIEDALGLIECTRRLFAIRVRRNLLAMELLIVNEVTRMIFVELYKLFMWYTILAVKSVFT